MNELQDKTVIITGASSGIGEAAAFLFAAEGANVVLGARREERLAEVVQRITQSGGAASAMVGDVRQESYSKSLVDHACAEFGGLDAAFNNAGIIGDLVSVQDMHTANWQNVLSTNLTSAFFAAKYQIPAMKTRGDGSLVFTSSFVGHASGGIPGMAAYAASKAGLIGFVQSIASEHGPDRIRANALLPGGTLTAMAGDDPAVHNSVSVLHSLKRMAEPEEIANAALFLLSERARFVTASALTCDGGISVTLSLDS